MPIRNPSLPLRLKVEALESRDTPSTLYALTNDSRIARFDSANPGAVDSTVAILGLNPAERVVGIDYRPRTGGLYGLAVDNNGTGTAGRLLLINPLTGAAGQVGAPIAMPVGDPSGRFGFDFNPTVDRIRVVTASGLNLRVNPNDGSVTPDANILLNGPVDAAAYDRNFDAKLGANGTTLFTINPVTGNLHTQGGVNQTPSPNTGTQFVVGPLNTPIDPTGSVGFDVAADGPAFAIFDGVAGAGVGTGLYSVNLTTGTATLIGLVGNGSGNFVGLAAVPESRIAVGTGGDTDSRVEVYDPFTGNRLRTIDPYPGFRGAVTTAVGDVNRDGILDIITGAGAGGGPHVKAFNGANGAELYSFYAYDPNFRGGVNVAAADVNGDGFAEVLTGAGAGGGPHVRAFSGNGLGELASFYAYDAAFAGGVRVAAGDFNNDGTDEIVTAAGPGGGPHVRVFARDLLGVTAPYTGGGIPNGFYAYAPTFAGGVFVTTGDINGDGFVDIVTGADAGGRAHVRGFSGRDGSEVSGFYAYGENFTGGARVGVGDTDRDGRVEVMVAPGAGGDPDVLAFDPNTGVRRRSFDVVDGSRGAFVGGSLV